MRRVRMICVGKLKERFYEDAAREYAKRLGRWCKLEMIELPERKIPDNPSPGEIEKALAGEATDILGKIPPHARVAALCIEGRPVTSEAFAAFLDGGEQAEKGLVFLIGSSYGLHARVKAAAQERLSMSPMTFPHHLARIMLLEQIYRGFQILEGGKYHK